MPAEQAVQPAAAVSDEYDPGAQAVQPTEEDTPVRVLYVPSTHAVQLVLAGRAL